MDRERSVTGREIPSTIYTGTLCRDTKAKEYMVTFNMILDKISQKLFPFTCLYTDHLQSIIVVVGGGI